MGNARDHERGSGEEQEGSGVAQRHAPLVRQLGPSILGYPANAAMESDFALLEAWKAGDDESGNALFERHFDALYRFFRNKVSDGIDDLVQQTMLACVRNRESFRQNSSFRTYLFGIARNILFHHFDRRSREGERFDWGTVSVADLGESPSRVVAARAEQRLLAAALRRVPLDDQILLELYYWENMSGPELAEALDLTEPAVRSRLRRSLERLRNAVEQLASSPVELESVSMDLERWVASLRQADA
jgi:RNA polymerase sigma factor (sigma-70 family)